MVRKPPVTVAVVATRAATLAAALVAALVAAPPARAQSADEVARRLAAEAEVTWRAPVSPAVERAAAQVADAIRAAVGRAGASA